MYPQLSNSQIASANNSPFPEASQSLQRTPTGDGTGCLQFVQDQRPDHGQLPQARSPRGPVLGPSSSSHPPQPRSCVCGTVCGKPLRRNEVLMSISVPMESTANAANLRGRRGRKRRRHDVQRESCAALSSVATCGVLLASLREFAVFAALYRNALETYIVRPAANGPGRTPQAADRGASWSPRPSGPTQGAPPA